MKKTFNILLLCICGLIGGALSDQFLRPALAERSKADMSRFYDERGQLRADLGVWKGQAIQDFYGEDGKLRIQLGTYDGSIAPHEKGLPSVSLYDNGGRIRLLFRLDGPNEGPLIIMKDKIGRNRLIMGLDLWDGSEEPFLATWDTYGKQTDIVGQFNMRPLGASQ